MRILCFFLIIITTLSCKDQDESLKDKTKRKKPSHRYTFSNINREKLKYIETVYAYIYSDIYFYDGTQKYPLTNTVSIRNTSLADTAFVLSATYYDSYGSLLEKYIDSTICLAPLESIEFVVEEYETNGGPGANFIIQWGGFKAANQISIQTIIVGIYRRTELSSITDAKVIEQVYK